MLTDVAAPTLLVRIIKPSASLVTDSYLVSNPHRFLARHFVRDEVAQDQMAVPKPLFLNHPSRDVGNDFRRDALSVRISFSNPKLAMRLTSQAPQQ